MKTLGAVSQSRDNNLNVIRALAAVAVLVSHAYPIALGPGTPEPVSALLGYSLGTMAVYIFFVISGYLITMSFVRTKHAGWFTAARIVRLMPGLIVSILIVAVPVGLWVTTLPVQTYLTHPDTLSFVLRNISMALPQYTLPGVFEDNPYPTIEGSIWTLFYEVACYGSVFLLGITGMLRHPRATGLLLGLFILSWAGKQALGATLFHQAEKLYELGLPFALGALMYLWRDKIPMTVLGLPVTAALAWSLEGTVFYNLSLHLAIGYWVFWIAFIPGGMLLTYNRLGDYSYGIYIYAFPAQGLAVWLYGPQTPSMNIAFALPLTLIPSVLSWHYVEKPCLDKLKAYKTRALARA